MAGTPSSPPQCNVALACWLPTGIRRSTEGFIVHRRIEPNCSMCDRPSSRSRLQICQFIDVTVSFIAKNECLVVPAACVGGWQGWEGSRVDIYE